MKTAVVVLAAIVSFGSVNSESLIMGDNFCNHVVFIRNVQFMGIPFVKREKDIFFSSNFNEKISRIAAIEKYPIKAKATVTAGGLGQTYVNIHLESQRGSGLYYNITIYS
ncbi:transcription activator MBF2 domain-containing protein [Phthorimaea operculella]|nr:transcription activator MBF2 domain-containing protein [Phthorimaea operculella]